VVYVDRLLQLFRYVPREQLTIPDFVFQLSLYVFQFAFLFIMPFRELGVLVAHFNWKFWKLQNHKWEMVN